MAIPLQHRRGQRLSPKRIANFSRPRKSPQTHGEGGGLGRGARAFVLRRPGENPDSLSHIVQVSPGRHLRSDCLGTRRKSRNAFFPTSQGSTHSPACSVGLMASGVGAVAWRSRTAAADCEEDRTLRAVLIGMLREHDR